MSFPGPVGELKQIGQHNRFAGTKFATINIGWKAHTYS